MVERRGWWFAVRLGAVAVAVALGAPMSDARHPGTWSLSAELPTALSAHGSVAIGDTVFVLGGVANGVVQDRVFALDRTSGVWSEMAAMPEPRAAFAAVVVGGSIYVIGGVGDGPHVARSSTLIYHSAADAWTVGSDLPTPRWGLDAAVLDGRIWAVGGATGDGFEVQSVLDAVEIYDPTTGIWLAEKDALELPVARTGLRVRVFEGRLWVVGGRAADGLTSSRVDVFDPEARVWSRGPSLNVARAQHAVAEVGDELFVFGGRGDNGRALDCVEALHGSWSRLGRMPQAAFDMAAAEVAGEVLLSGGLRHGDAFPYDVSTPKVATADLSTLLVYEAGIYSYWADVAAHLAGANGSLWRTTLSAVNAGEGEASVSLILHGEHGDGRAEMHIAAGAQAIVEDVVGLMGLDGKGMLEVRSDEPLMICGRTYTESEHGSYGQACDLRPTDVSCGASGTMWLTGLRQTTGVARTNLVLANSGLWRVAVAVTLYGADGLELHRYALTVEPGQVVQDLEPFARRAGFPDLGCGFAKVQVAQGSGLFASASVIDAVSNDATTVYPKE